MIVGCDQKRMGSNNRKQGVMEAEATVRQVLMQQKSRFSSCATVILARNNQG